MCFQTSSLRMDGMLPNLFSVINLNTGSSFEAATFFFIVVVFLFVHCSLHYFASFSLFVINWPEDSSWKYPLVEVFLTVSNHFAAASLFPYWACISSILIISEGGMCLRDLLTSFFGSSVVLVLLNAPPLLLGLSPSLVLVRRKGAGWLAASDVLDLRKGFTPLVSVRVSSFFFPPSTRPTNDAMVD